MPTKRITDDGIWTVDIRIGDTTGIGEMMTHTRRRSGVLTRVLEDLHWHLGLVRVEGCKKKKKKKKKKHTTKVHTRGGKQI